MRALKAAAAALILIFSTLLPMSAFATHAVPISTTFTATGPLNIDSYGLNIPCIATLVLTTDAVGNVRITQMTMSSSALCEQFAAKNLPWTSTLGGSVAIFSNAMLVNPLFGCSGGIAGNFTSPGLMSINGIWGACQVSAFLTISPAFSIVGP